MNDARSEIVTPENPPRPTPSRGADSLARSATEGSSAADDAALAVDSAWAEVSKGGIAWPKSLPPVDWEFARRRLSEAFARLPNGDRWRAPSDYAAFIQNQSTGRQWYQWFELYGPDQLACHTKSLIDEWEYDDGDGLWLAIGGWACRHEWYLGCDPTHPSWGRVIDAEDCHPRSGEVVAESFVEFLLGPLSTALANHRAR